MNSHLDWFVLSDYYSICVTNAPPGVMVCKFFLQTIIFITGVALILFA